MAAIVMRANGQTLAKIVAYAPAALMIAAQTGRVNCVI
jgi:hypothetical protein